METTTARGPKTLPWLAKKAGISEHRAQALWRAARRYAAFATGESETPAYWQASMDRLLELIAAEALREDAASFGMRRWSRLQAKAVQAPLAVFDVVGLGFSRACRLLAQTMRPTAL